MMYWLRFSPAPPWQLEDLHPTAPMNWASALRVCFISLAEASAQAAIKRKQIHLLWSRNTRRDYHPERGEFHVKREWNSAREARALPFQRLQARSIAWRSGRSTSMRPRFPAFADRFGVATDVDLSQTVRAFFDRFGRVFVFFLQRFEEGPEERQ
jgi:hypothetical protein